MCLRVRLSASDSEQVKGGRGRGRRGRGERGRRGKGRGKRGEEEEGEGERERREERERGGQGEEPHDRGDAQSEQVEGSESIHTFTIAHIPAGGDAQCMHATHQTPLVNAHTHSSLMQLALLTVHLYSVPCGHRETGHRHVPQEHTASP